jgi:NAD(P)-dependent dehydrogenase (short-subunit alcohol dehydrogenase family)
MFRSLDATGRANAANHEYTLSQPERGGLMNRLQGKVAIVTGAAQGIGFGCARMLASEGAAVVLGDLQKERGEQAAEVIRKEGGRAVFCAMDLRKEADCKALIAAAIDNFGRLDGLVNNAGWFPRATLEETTTEFWDEVLQVNLRGAFYCCKFAVAEMKKARRGSIVNIGSICGIQSLPNLVAYGAAKGGLLALTRTLAGALAEHQIRVNYVIPGWVLSEGELALHAREGRDAETLRKMGEKLPLGRHQTPQDVANGVTFLLSDEASQVTGTILNTDAGASSLPIPPGLFPG